MKCVYKHCSNELKGKQKKFCSDNCKMSYHTINNRHNRKIKAVEYKGGQCEFCGYSRCLRALEFHHKDPTKKDFQISANPNISWENMKIELDKCLLLCSNCHAEEHEAKDKVSVPGSYSGNTAVS